MYKKAMFVIRLSLCLILFKGAVFAQVKAPKTVSEIKKIRFLANDVKLHPESLKAHEAYISSFALSDTTLQIQYKKWEKEFPNSFTVPFAIGKALQTQNMDSCEGYLLKAAAVKPHMAETWSYLSNYEASLGNVLASRNYLLKAKTADPKNAEYAFQYSFTFKDDKPALYDSLMLEVVNRFPESEEAAEALYFLSGHPYNADLQEAYFNALYKMSAPKQIPWVYTGMENHFNLLIKTSPEKAFELALNMCIRVKTNRDTWKQRLKIARSFFDAQKLINNKQYAGASEILKTLDLGKRKTLGILVDAEETLALFKAEAYDGDNKTQMAYDSLVNFYSSQPSDILRKALTKYALKLNIDTTRIQQDIWDLRNSLAWKETNFTLKDLRTGKDVSLSQYKGQVVLLTYWFPSCFPCREEFPHFESVLKKFDKKDIAYLAINAGNRDESYIIPFISNKKYSFVPLRDSPNKAIGSFPIITSAPTNFLIDKNGRVIFSDFRINDTNERTLELMIGELLNTPSPISKVFITQKINN